MGTKREERHYQWQGSEKRLYRGEPLIRFIIPKRGNHNHNSIAYWNYQDKVLTIDYWIELPYAADKKSGYKIKYALKDLFNPENDMIIVDNSTIKNNSSMVLNIQYFARLSAQPTAEDMTAMLKAIEGNIIPMSLYEYRLIKAAEQVQWQKSYNEKMSRQNDGYNT